LQRKKEFEDVGGEAANGKQAKDLTAEVDGVDKVDAVDAATAKAASLRTSTHV
jgi:hypothetical protein